MTDMDLHDLRHDFISDGITESSTSGDPFQEFEKWFNHILTKGNEQEPNAMTVASVASDTSPNIRVVLLKEVTSQGFVFFTNYESNKGKEFAQNPKSCINFFWVSESQQIKVKGVIKKLSREHSVHYFESRPIGSQIGAAVSPQSQKISSRKVLDEKIKSATEEINEGEKTLECPENWGGYVLEPNYFEFWQGRPSRLHDRIIYELDGNKKWFKYRIAP